LAKTTETISEFTMNILTAEQYADAKKNNQIDPNQLYFTPEKKLVVAVSQDKYESMKEAGTLDEDVLYVTPASESVTIPEATETTAGLMPPSAVTKLKGIDEGANKYTHPLHTARTRGLYKITVDSLGHVTAVSAVQKSDITDLGIPSSDTTYDLASAYSNGLMSSTQYSKLSGIESGANKTTVDATLSSSSANPVQNKIVYAALPWEYSATFYVDSWNTATSDEQAQGFAYRQVVTPVKKISVAPTITANSMFLGFGSPSDSSVLATKVTLAEAANVINGGLVYTGSNSITALVEEKPTSDVTMTWWLRT
jgi:hypothetical protein